MQRMNIKCCHCGDYTPFITEENIEVIHQVNLTRTDMDSFGDIAETLRECGCLAMMMLRAGSQLARSQRCGGVEMLRKIAEYVKKIFRMEPIPMTVNTLREALQALEVARNHFEHCDPEFVDAAIFELNAAECRVDAVRRCVG